MCSAKVVILLAAVAVCYGAPNAKFSKHHLNIDGGNNAEIEDFPYVASVQYCPFACTHVCTALIINENWVLTGANCIASISAQKVDVGASDLTQDDKVTVDIEAEFIHPDAPSDGFGPNDLALLKLSQPLTFNDKVQAAKLPKQGQEFTGIANVTGFGNSKFSVRNDLRTARDVTLISNDDCTKAINEIFPDVYSNVDEKSNLCTLSKTANSCDGDLGGPLSQDGTVIGVVTWHLKPCGYRGIPTVYTKLSNFMDWIEKTITENK
ncbi:unnamed protein product [Psylliodes chrysocephalus]|uniref:Peptidase S1 domain-containing protein n=1 Tax=Psylliodes chrysocephalus TaxID=3402493 RepID=A0A9P0D7T7_9CUCU|nr:unnamed protein product [Psylliodes chrysocephala]